MSQLHEKAVKHAFTVNENVTAIAAPPDDGDVAKYKESERTWRSYIWSCKPSCPHGHWICMEDELLIAIALDVPKDEARFLTKLDLTLISASALGVMCRYLDQVNITNAFSRWLGSGDPQRIPVSLTADLLQTVA